MAKVDLLKTYKARLSAILADILGEPSKYSITGNEELLKVEEIQMEAICCKYIIVNNVVKISLKFKLRNSPPGLPFPFQLTLSPLIGRRYH